MRGKLSAVTLIQPCARITPADAGKTRMRIKKLRSARDHPRGCGENVDMPTEARETLGSPPRMRGKRNIMMNTIRLIRITPADAGKTATRLLENIFKQDHLRGCGENGDPSIGKYIQTGSPPQVRGKRWGVQNGWLSDRITPAGAGKTLSPPHGGGLHPDHPRRCGENPHT